MKKVTLKLDEKDLKLLIEAIDASIVIEKAATMIGNGKEGHMNKAMALMALKTKLERN